MPECLLDKNIRVQVLGIHWSTKYGFPPKTCGNDRFDIRCKRLQFLYHNFLIKQVVTHYASRIKPHKFNRLSEK